MTTRFLILLFLLSTTVYAQRGVRFTPESGVHKDLNEIRIDLPTDGNIYFTDNGEQPTIKSKRLSTSSLKITRNTSFRFLYINKEGDEKHFSKTYIVDRKHDLPILSIITEPSKLFDEETGIYSKGCCADSEKPFKGANFWNNWEKKVIISYVNENNEQVIDQSAGIQMFGGFSLAMPQKSFGLYAREKYGVNKFNYPFFENRPFKKYNNLVLRNAGSDMQGAHIRDAFATTLVGSTGLLVQAYRPVAVYINGVYWGKYNLREKINEHFIKQHTGYNKDSLIIMRHEKSVQYGSSKDYVEFWNRLKELDLSKKEDLEYVDSKIDIDNYLLYNICEVYTGNADAGGNIRYYRHTSDTSKWRWIFYDVDHRMNIFSTKARHKNSVSHFTTEHEREWPHPNWSTFLIRKLLENDSIKNRYIIQFSDLINTVFRADNAKFILDSLKNDVANEIIYHKKRWSITDNIYEFSFNKLYNYIERRPQILQNQLKKRFMLGDLVKVKVINSEGGVVRLNTLLVNDSFHGSYYINTRIQVEAKPDFGYTFDGWKNSETKGKLIDIILKDSMTFTPIFKKRNVSKFKGIIIINEIDAEQDSIKDTDYVELANIGDEVVDLKGWIISDGPHNYRVKESIQLYPGEYFVFTEKKDVLRRTYAIENSVGGLGFGISKKGEIVTIYDEDSLIVDRVSTTNWKSEAKKMNWSRVSQSCNDELYNSWVQERPTPGSKNRYCSELEKKKNKSTDIRYWLFIVGGVLSLLGLAFILFIFKRTN